MANIDETRLTYLLDRLAISDVQLRYATGADTRDWVLYRSCFTDEIDTDFTSVFGSRYVRRLLRLAFLAPDIVEAIAAGDQPSELTAGACAGRIDFPLLWTAQASKSRRDCLVGSLSIISSHFGQVRRGIDPIARR